MPRKCKPKGSNIQKFSIVYYMIENGSLDNCYANGLLGRPNGAYQKSPNSFQDFQVFNNHLGVFYII